ncbi:MAG: hypothetical protein K5873_10890 [Treponema sp.]|nr:hypothetical protein [Treponema sp.]
MKKLLMKCLFASLMLFSSYLFAVEVNQDELKAGQADSIQFENYGGPHAVIESADSITGIGVALGKEVLADIENPLAVQPQGKYSLYHVVGSPEEKGLDADILFLNQNAMVDHINNLRRIISGYLMTAYSYSKEDAETLSVFVTVYNAVYRGNLENFSSKYKASVLTYLTDQACGLSTNWEEWAGKSQIVIPLGVLAAEGESTIDTSVISDENVIEAIRQDEDKGLEVREKMTEIKEKEASGASEKAKTAQKEAAQEKKEGKKEEAEKSAKKASEEQALADRKTEEVKTEKEAIAKDKKELAKEEAGLSAEVTEKYLTSLFIVDEKEKLYSLMTVNPKNGEIVRKSELKQIREKSIYPVNDVDIVRDTGETASFAELFVAVCGVKDKRSAIRLCLVDAGDLQIQKQSSEDLSENSPLIKQGDEFYVIISEGKNYYLASYDKNLTLKKKSAVAIKGSSPLNIYSEGVLVTDSKGKPVLLKHSDFSSVWQSSVTDAK